METDSKDMSSNIMCMNIRYFIWIIELVELKHNACGHNISPVQHIFFFFKLSSLYTARQTSGKCNMHLFVSYMNKVRVFIEHLLCPWHRVNKSK